MNIYKLRSRLTASWRHAREFGIRSTASVVLDRLLRNSVARKLRLEKSDVLDRYAFVTLPEAVTLAARHQDGTINWVVPPFGKGSGGHLNIFRFVSHLETLGFSCRIVIVCGPPSLTADLAEQQIKNWFFPVRASVHVGMENAPPAQYTIATEWRTAYWVRNFPATRHRCYFIQDFEPWFYPVGSEYVFAEETYRFGFVGLTAGGWLEQKIASDYGMQTHALGFSCEKGLYRPCPRTGDGRRKVFFYARPPTARRAFELGLLALDRLCQLVPDVEVVFAGWDVSGYAIPFPHCNAGLLPVEALPKLYGQCDVALVLSFSNLSLLPLELMACGTPVVSNSAPWTEWLLTDANSRLAPATVDGLAEAMRTVLIDKVEAERIRQGGFATVAATEWSAEAQKMALVLRGLEPPQDR